MKQRATADSRHRTLQFWLYKIEIVLPLTSHFIFCFLLFICRGIKEDTRHRDIRLECDTALYKAVTSPGQELEQACLGDLVRPGFHEKRRTGAYSIQQRVKGGSEGRIRRNISLFLLIKRSFIESAWTRPLPCASDTRRCWRRLGKSQVLPRPRQPRIRQKERLNGAA